MPATPEALVSSTIGCLALLRELLVSLTHQKTGELLTRAIVDFASRGRL